MENKDLIRNYESDIRIYEDKIEEIEQCIRKLKQKIENQETSYYSVKKEKNRVSQVLENNKRKSSNLPQKYPKTKFVIGVSEMMKNFELENHGQLISSIDNDVKQMKKEILKNYDLISDYEMQISRYKDKLVGCHQEIDYLRSKANE